MDKSKARKRETILLVAFVILVIAIVFVRGVIKYRNAQVLIADCTASTYGTVTKVERTQRLSDSSSKWRNAYYIEAVFYVNDIKYIASATERRGDNDHGQNARFHTDTTITIMYNPSDPNESYIKAAVMDTGRTEMLSVVLVPAVIIFCVITDRKNRKKDDFE